MEPMDLPVRTRVAIVGAGPTGLALAVTLASAGVDFVVVDRLAEGANTSRAAVVHARTMEVLAELGAAEELVARGLPISRFALRDGSRRLLTVPFDQLPTPYPFTLMIPQYETEAVLLARLRTLGADVHRPYQVDSVVQDTDGVTLTMTTGQTLTFGSAGLTVVAPLPGGRYRIVATVDEAPPDPDQHFVQRLLDERAPGQG